MRAGFWEILLIVLLVLVLFGHGKVPDLMKNLANGINVFKKELKTDAASAQEKPVGGQKQTVAKKKATKTKAKVKAKAK